MEAAAVKRREQRVREREAAEAEAARSGNRSSMTISPRAVFMNGEDEDEDEPFDDGQGSCSGERCRQPLNLLQSGPMSAARPSS